MLYVVLAKIYFHPKHDTTSPLKQEFPGAVCFHLKFVRPDTNVSGYCTANITEGSCKK